MSKVMEIIKNRLPTVVSSAAGGYGGLVTHIPKLVGFLSEHNRSKEEIARIKAQLEVIKSEIDHRYDLYNNSLTEMFGERRSNIDRIFDVIEKGMEKNDTEIVLGGLRAVSDLVSTSPFKDMESLGRLINSGKSIDL
jgi:NADPH-dependent curcumin reductase CurA